MSKILSSGLKSEGRTLVVSRLDMISPKCPGISAFLPRVMSFEFNFVKNDLAIHSSFGSSEASGAPAIKLAKVDFFLKLITKPVDGEIYIISEPLTLSPQLSLLKRMISDVKFEMAHKDSLDASAEAPLAKIIQSQSDLITGVYEGGLKTWECSLDLVRYLDDLPESEWNHARVMEVLRLRNFIFLAGLRIWITRHLCTFKRSACRFSRLQ